MMVIRRIRTHAATHNWFAVAVDLVVVGIGVFIGIEAANWNQRRIERAEATEYRSLIIDNLRANEADISARMAYYGQIRAHAVAALEALQDSGTKLNHQFVVDAYQASQGWFRPLQRTAYELPVETGVRRGIGDVQTQAEFAAYQQFASGFDSNALRVTAYRDRLRSEMGLPVQLAIRKSCDDIIRNLPGGGQAPQLPGTCQLDLDPALIEQTARKLAAMPGLKQDLTRLIVDIDQKLGTFGRGLQAARRLRARLEASA
jgi:hypothetical protein